MFLFPSMWLVATVVTAFLWLNGLVDGSIPAWIAVSGPVWFLVASIRVVDEWDRVVVLRLGRFAGLRGPGLVLVIPFIEWVSRTVDMRIRTQLLTSETAMTKDSVSVKVEAVMVWSVSDAKTAAVDVADYQRAVERAGMVSLRETIGAIDLDKLLSAFDEVDRKITESLIKRTKNWGVKVASVDIRDIAIDLELREVMSRDAQAKREQRARVTLAGAEVEIANQMELAGRIYDRSPTALRLREMELVHEMGKDNSTIIIPTEMLTSVSGVSGKAFVSGLVGSAAMAVHETKAVVEDID
jgi:RNA polymerase-interacting CarD/CdnL/TRCF family regulator